MPAKIKKQEIAFFVSVFLFGFCFSGGFSLAKQKPLWNDEFYTQTSSVDRQSYGSILLGRTSEGNNYPLFYLIQKTMCGIFRYSTPPGWSQGDWKSDPYSEIFLRINPNLFMSLSIAVIFYYFSRFYSMAAGLFSVFLSFSSYMVWNYWAEARPYALWCFLTTLQFLSFLYIFRPGNESGRGWRWLVVSHFLLALTVVFGLIQIIFASFLVWIFLERRWRKLIWLTVIPVGISLFYYSHTPQYNFCFSLTPEQLIRECFSRDRFYIMFLFVLFLGLSFIQKKTGCPKLFGKDTLIKGLPCLFLTLLMILGALCVLFIFKLKDSHTGFAVTSRYFIYLTPIGIIATTLFSEHLIKSLSAKRWLQMVIFLIIGYWVLARAVKNIPFIEMFFEKIIL